MKGFSFYFVLLVVLASGCNEDRLIDQYVDFEDRYWLVSEKPRFTFAVEDTASAYNVYIHLRNATTYPYSRIFVNFSMQDSTGRASVKKLLNQFLFEAKTGKPLGKSGLGDIYDHRIPVLSKHTFSGKGPYVVELEQYMRTDSLAGILSVGVAVEKAAAK